MVIAAAAGAAVAGGLQPAAAAGVGGTGQAIHAQAAVAPHAATNGKTSCTAAGTGTTCTGTFSGNNAYDPTGPNGMSTKTPTVTVDQTSNLTNQIVHISWTNFTPSFNPNGDTAINPTSPGLINFGVAIYECRTETPTANGFYDPTQNDCYPVWDPALATAGPRNGILTVTRPGTADTSQVNDGNDLPASCSTAQPGDSVCGTGSADFQVETSVENSKLGCDQNHACSIVVEPQWGGYDASFGVVPNPDDDPNPPPAPTTPAEQLNFTYDCSIHFSNAFGVNVDDASVLGLGTLSAWGDSCSWANRIVVPITFAPVPSAACKSSSAEFSSEGSPALEKAMGQWRSNWCTAAQNKVNFDYNSAVNEYAARSDFLSGGSGALTESTDIALVNRPASSDLTAASSRKFTYAPIAVTNITVAYYVDDVKTGQQVDDLKLDARLLAKLLTESYSESFNLCDGVTKQTQTCDTNVIGNPTNIFQDPEFYHLNPQYTEADFASNTTGDSIPVVLAGNSDMTYELTRWIASDPDAGAFLAGKPDPWGMHVNDAFKGAQTYPIDLFLGQDVGYSVPATQALNGPPPGWDLTMPATFNPVTGIDNIAARLAIWQSGAVSFGPTCSLSSDENICRSAGNGWTNSKNAPEFLGKRGLFAILDSGSATAFRFPAAQLVNPAGDAVAPSTDSMSAAVSAMKTNPDKITQFQDYSATSPQAYPLTEVQYAMVPTCGLTSAKAQAITAFLNQVNNSQTYGTQPGQLPPFGGYLTLNTAQRAQVQSAARSVSTQSCTTPPPDETVSGSTGSDGGHSSSTGSLGGGLGGGTGGLGGGLPLSPSGSPSGASGNGSPSGSPSSSPSGGGQEPVGLGTKSGDESGAARYVLPIALAVGALLAIGGPLAYLFGTGAMSLPYGRRRGSGPGAGDE